MIINRHKQRIDSILEYFSPYVKERGMDEWRFFTMSLYSFLDWANFRGIIDKRKYPLYMNFLKAHSEREIVRSTEIPQDA
jgi:hypothetical protein